MADIISFYFDILRMAWSLIIQYWFLSAAVLLAVFRGIISTVNNTKGN